MIALSRNLHASHGPAGAVNGAALAVSQRDAELLVADDAQVKAVAQCEAARIVVQVRVEGRPLALVEGTAVVRGGIIDLVVGRGTAAHVVLVIEVE